MADQNLTGSTSSGPDPMKAGHTASGASRSQDAQQAARRAEHHAREVVDQAKNQLQSVLSDQKQAAAGQLEGIVNALRTTAEQLRKQDQSSAATYVERAAVSLDRFCGTLRERDINSLAVQVQDLARRQPALFLGGAVAAGFMIARFLKSSSASSDDWDEPHAGESTYGSSGATPNTAYPSGPNYTQGGSSVDPISTPT